MSAPQNQKNAIEILGKDDYAKVSTLEKDLKVFKQQNDPRFGDITIYQHARSKNYIAVKQHVVNDQKAAAELIVWARKRLLQQYPHVLSILDYSVEKKSELCATNYIIKFFFDYPHSDLLRECLERHKAGVAFSHEELIHYLYQQLHALQFLEFQGRFHGDVRPLHISLSKLEILSKIIDKSDLISNRDKARQVQAQHLIQKDSLYVPPFYYEQLKKNSLKFESNSHKDDAYALGLSILEAGVQTSIQNIYDVNGAFNHQNLDLHLHSFKNRYVAINPLLTSTLFELLKANENERPAPSEILGKMPPYQSIIDFLKRKAQNDSNPLSRSLLPEPVSLKNNQVIKVNAELPGDNNTSVTNSTTISGNWVPKIEHKYIRADKSVERPVVVPYYDENSKVLVHTTPFPDKSDIIVKSIPPVVTKSIENPDNVVYMAPQKKKLSVNNANGSQDKKRLSKNDKNENDFHPGQELPVEQDHKISSVKKNSISPKPSTARNSEINKSPSIQEKPQSKASILDRRPSNNSVEKRPSVNNSVERRPSVNNSVEKRPSINNVDSKRESIVPEEKNRVSNPPSKRESVVPEEKGRLSNPTSNRESLANHSLHEDPRISIQERKPSNIDIAPVPEDPLDE